MLVVSKKRSCTKSGLGLEPVVLVSLCTDLVFGRESFAVLVLLLDGFTAFLEP